MASRAVITVHWVIGGVLVTYFEMVDIKKILISEIVIFTVLRYT